MGATQEASAGLTLTIGPHVRGANFFGRQKQVEELWDQLQQASVLLMAPRRVGKSSLLMALKDEPRDGFEVHYINLESAAHPAQFVAALAEALNVSPGLRDTLSKIPVVGELLKATEEIKLGEGSIRFAGPDWRDVGKKIIDALREPTPGQKATKGSKETKGDGLKRLFLLDEFPYFIQHMAKGPGGKGQCDEFLGWFRKLRCDPLLCQRIRYVLCGSIGLSGLLGRLGLSASVNDIRDYRLGPFERPTAMSLLHALEVGEKCPLQLSEREELLDAIGYLTPYYIQLLFAEVKALGGSAPPDRRIATAFRNLLAHKDSQLRHMEERLSVVFEEAAERARAEAVLQEACAKKEGVSYSQAAQAVNASVPDTSDRSIVEILQTLAEDGYLSLDYDDDDRMTGLAFTSELLRRYWKRLHPAAASEGT